MRVPGLVQRDVKHACLDDSLMQTQPVKARKNKQLITLITQFRRRVLAGAGPGASLPSAGLGSYRPLRACQIHGAWAAWRADRPIRSSG